MATMKSRLEGKAEVVRRNVVEIKLLKAIAKETLKKGVSATICMGKLYDAILMSRRVYGSEEIRRFVDVALQEAERALKEEERLDSRWKMQDSKDKFQDAKKDARLKSRKKKEGGER